jgi:hypothetical protein
MFIERDDDYSVVGIDFCCDEMAAAVLSGGILDGVGSQLSGIDEDEADWSFCPWCGTEIEDGEDGEESEIVEEE